MKDIEIVVFQDKSWVRLTEYQKLQEENEQLKKEIIEIEKVSDYRFEENEQLKKQIKTLKEGKQYETCPYRSTDMGCDYCDYRDRDLKDEWELAE